MDGEGLEGLAVRLQLAPESPRTTTFFAHHLLNEKRRLTLAEQVLLAKPPQPGDPGPAPFSPMAGGLEEDQLAQPPGSQFASCSDANCHSYWRRLKGEPSFQVADLKGAKLSG